MRTLLTVVVACLLSPVVIGQMTEHSVLQVGVKLEGYIEDGDPPVETEALIVGGYTAQGAVVGKTFRLEVAERGASFIDLRSYFFDAYLVLRDAAGNVLAEDDDGLIQRHARIVCQLDPSQTYTVTVGALHGGRGLFELTMASGDPVRLDSRARTRAEVSDAERRLEIVEASRGPEHLLTAASLNTLARLLKAQGQFAEARTLFERALAICEATLGAEHPSTATMLNNLADLLRSQGDYVGARRFFERALAIREVTLGAEHPMTARSLGNLAGLMHAQGETTTARPLLERALAIHEATLGPEHPDTATSLSELAGVLFAQGDYGGAVAHYGRALAIFESVLGSDDLFTARCLGSLAGPLEAQGDFATARPLLERALSIHEAALGPNHPDTGTSLINLANVLKAQGNYSAAFPLYQRALKICESSLGPAHPATAAALSNLAVILNIQGDYARSRPLLERALEIHEATFGSAHPETAKSLNNLGLLLQEQGDLDGARQLHERALAIQKARWGPEHPETLRSMRKLSSLFFIERDFVGAREMLEHVLAIQESSLGAEHPGTAQTLSDLATLASAQGDLVAGRQLFEQALASFEAALGSDHLDTARCSSNLAALLFDHGEHSMARPLFERALVIQEAGLGPGHPVTASSLNNLATLLLDERANATALTIALRSAEHRHLLRRNLVSLTEEAAFRYLETMRWQRFILLSAAEAAGNEMVAHAAVLRFKGEVGRLHVQTREQLRAQMAPGSRLLSDRFEELQTQLSFLRLKTEVAGRDAHEALILDVSRERDEVDRELRRLTGFTELDDIGPADVARALPADSVLVDLLVHPIWLPARLDEHGTPQETGRWGDPRVSAWVIRADDGSRESKSVTHVDLGSSVAMDAAVRRHLMSLGSARDARGDRLGAVERRQLGHDLATLVWEPLARSIGDAKTVFICPDGALATVPFETLRDREGHYLVEAHGFIYLTSGADLLKPDERQSERELDLLAVGGIDYDGRASEHEARALVGESNQRVATTRDREWLRGFPGDWGHLPATGQEIEAVSQLHAEVAPGARRLMLRGAEATERRLKVELPRHGLVHLATHGYFRPDGLPSMVESARRTDKQDAWSGAKSGLASLPSGVHPGLLSGLVFAGANVAADETNLDDGYLTASEVSSLDLSSVELVVLSACETGLGRVQAGDGLIGLRRAFHMAGADTVIGSLWAVGDESTAQLMTTFYANLLAKRMGRHEALRQAQLEMLSRNRATHGVGLPRTWGAFVLSGEWR